MAKKANVFMTDFTSRVHFVIEKKLDNLDKVVTCQIVHKRTSDDLTFLWNEMSMHEFVIRKHHFFVFVLQIFSGGNPSEHK